MNDQMDLRELLPYINPASLSYQEWLSVGMALKLEGYPVEIWDNWSKADSRYHQYECQKKWNTFQGSITPVTAASIVQLAKDNGWTPADYGRSLEWEDAIDKDLVIIDKDWVEGTEIHEPEHWDPVRDLIRYLETLFDSTDNVGYVTQSWEKDGKHFPSRGSWDRTAGELIEQLSKCHGDLGAVLGDYDPEVGAWIRFNPLDGQGCRNDNVTEYRYALVESDETEIEKQNAIIRELELPIACLVHSGKKSLHAIVRIDAGDVHEYRKRVDYLYKVCEKNGIKVDTQNRNPSRLSRMPGIFRNGKKQYLVDTNLGKSSWDEWYEWIEGINDDLPEPEPLESVWDNLPKLSPCLIDNVLRQGHKMLISGPSKAGKSFLLIELCIAIAEGRKWLDFACSKGKVMYVNLELDRASCLHRFKDVYQTLGWQPRHLGNIDIWNLRGKSIPMDKLAPKLIRRAAKKNYTAIILDPIYKVITGDENSADQMAKFCNQFDKVCTELGCSVIYCHHHSKGSQGNKKSMDRASGSGVFARDPDALLDLIELETTEALINQEENKAICAACHQYLNAHYQWQDDLSQDDLLSSAQMIAYCKKVLDRWQMAALEGQIKKAKNKVKNRTAWRIEGTLREFPKFEPINLWFDYPTHQKDASRALSDIEPEKEKPFWKKGKEAREKQGEVQRKNKQKKYSMAIESFRFEHDDTYPTVKELYEQMKSDAEATGEKYPAEKTVRNSLKSLGYTVNRETSRICPKSVND